MGGLRSATDTSGLLLEFSPTKSRDSNNNKNGIGQDGAHELNLVFWTSSVRLK